MSQRIVGSGYLKIFRTKELRTQNFQIQRTVGTRYFKKLEGTAGLHERAYPKALGGYLI
jgi:hypothetical protein